MLGFTADLFGVLVALTPGAVPGGVAFLGVMAGAVAGGFLGFSLLLGGVCIPAFGASVFAGREVGRGAGAPWK